MAQTYNDYTLPKLWEMLEGEDPETGFAHVNTLNRLRTALEQQRDNLRAQRDRLIEGWPPDRSEAATAFVGRINDMIDVMTYTASAAGRICTGVDGVFAAIRDARRQMEPMMADYSKRSPGRGLQVGNARHAELDQRGRDVLIAADAKVADASGMINSSLPPYRRIRDSGESTTLIASDANAPGSPTVGQSGGGGNQSAVLRAPVFDPPQPSAPVGNGTGGFADGPVLAGEPTAQPPTPGGGNSVGYPGSGPVGLIGGGAGPGQSASGPNGAVGFRPGGVGVGGVIGEPRPYNPAGGQITGAPMTGIGPRTGSTQAARRQTGRSAVSSNPLESRGASGISGGYRDRSFEAYAERRRSKRRGDDDELWSVEEGVSPVLDATTERSHDPGPGVLGIDR
ncbi:hypothetical protein [Dactylosporangium sp. NPDC048998]|uniref:hypothetical protein n=1 Tax=Dactylosporangium sp. NPDC048998 TaxID=3363976 RepID=UPI0037249A60